MLNLYRYIAAAVALLDVIALALAEMIFYHQSGNIQSKWCTREFGKEGNHM